LKLSQYDKKRIPQNERKYNSKAARGGRRLSPWGTALIFRGLNNEEF
jgi:hypothetical protein